MIFHLKESLEINPSEIKETLVKVLDEHNSCYYESTAMCLELICEKLYYEYHINAFYKGRSIYIDNQRVATICVDKEGYRTVGMYSYTVFI
jgi:hypothetical protein